MANSYNSQPIILDTDIASGWRALQNLATKQIGIRPTKLIIESNGTTVAGTVSIVDPNDSTQLYLAAIGAGAGAAGTVLVREDFPGWFPAWRDFKVTGLTATVTKIFIWYRQ